MGEDNVTNFPKEFLNKLEFTNIPPHELQLKIGAHVMIIRNIKSPIMMNGTRAIIEYLGKHIIEAKISSGEFKG